jgi:hypothetical protein
MRDKNSKEEAKPDNEQDLEAKVDEMMDPRAARSTEEIKKESEALTAATDAQAGKGPEIDIFSDVKTAPEIPGAPDTKLDAKEVPKETASPAEAESADANNEPTISEDDMQKPIGNLNEEFEDNKTEEAVDEITKEESDKLLDAEDAKLEKAFDNKKPSFGQRLKGFFSAWWENKIARYITLSVILAGLIGLAVWPTSRYFVLNTAGVRSSTSLTVIDASTDLPLKNVSVTLGALHTKSNENGEVRFSRVKLGPNDLTIDRVAFATIHKKVTIGWGSNPLGEMQLTATGAQYAFNVRDYLSGQPLAAEATSGEASAIADKKGKIVLTVDNPETDTISVTIATDGYRKEKLDFAANTKAVTNIMMVPDKPIVYVSKQSGKYDLYKMDVDGKNKAMILAGTGRERSSMSVAVSPDGTQAVLVSSRGTQRDANRYLLDTLTLVDLKTNEAKTVDDAQNIRLIDWVGKRLVYSASYAAPSAATGNRQRIIAYNTDQNTRAPLASSDYFNGVLSKNNYIYYAVASSDPNQASGLYRIKVDGTGKQTVLNKQVWSLVRTEAQQLSIETPEGWYDYRLGDITAEKGDAPADMYTSRQYVELPNTNRSLWIENRDGKGTLLVHDEKSSKDTVVVSASGVTAPMRWLNGSTVTYRVANGNETAEYAKSLNGGEAKKLADVTNTAGLNINY